MDKKEVLELIKKAKREKSDFLDLSGEKIGSLPPEICELKQLTVLSLSNNQLTTLPREICELKQLTLLYLSNNQLTTLPREIRNLTKLEQLFLHDNPELNIPQEILGPAWKDVFIKGEKPASPRAILDYYFRTIGKPKPLNEAKLILVGPGEAGKTSIVKRLRDKGFNPKESTTHGIRITPWKAKLDQDEIRLNVWDFGGQEIMHATHKFFLTHRSLYLIVLDGRKGREDEDAEYWLKYIKTFGGGSPTIIVMNKQKLHPYDLNRRGLQEKYPFIRSFIPTDCSRNRKNGIPELKRAIRDTLGKMPEVRTPFHETWFKIKKRLEKMKQPFISFKDYQNICAELNEKEEQTQENLAYYLNCLGIALNYRNDPRLNETSVLKPQWITKGIYRIINSGKLKNTKGELRYSDLSRILLKKDYPKNKYNFLLNLMRKFELCFEFHDAGEGRRFLVPELLDIQKPGLGEEFSPENCLNFRYEYKILPEGILPRFIVRTYPMSENLDRWRTGVVLKWEGCRALVEADKSERQVVARVNGPKGRRRRLLAVIRSNFDHIHFEMKEFKPEEWIAPETHPREWVSYNDLEVHAREGETEYTKSIGNKLVKMDPAKLIDHADVKRAIYKEDFDRLGVSRGEREPVKTFIVYSHKDDYWRDKLQSNLDILVRERIITVWHDQRITPGDDWDEEIMKKLEESEIILLLVSTPMLASEYIQEKELPKALKLHKSGKARVIPVIISSCSWGKTALKKIQALPKGGKNIKKHPDKDKALLEVEEGIRKAAKKKLPGIKDSIRK